MADNHEGIERTEAPSPRWVAQVRERGHWPRSPELVVACVILAGMLAVRLASAGLTSGLIATLQAAFSSTCIDSPAADQIAAWREWFVSLFPGVLLAIGVPTLAGAAAGLAQTGLRFHPDALVPQLDRLNPITRLSRMFSLQSAGGGLLRAAKWLGLFALALCWVWRDVAEFGRDAGERPEQFSREATGLLFDLGTKLAFALLLIGLLDYARAWWSWQRQMRMSRAELAAEMREAEGAPLIRRRRRQLQMDRTLARSQTPISAEHVVFVGKGRLAVAARVPAHGAPVVLARAIGPAADRLRHAARARGAKILRDDATARSLYRTARGHATSASDAAAVPATSPPFLDLF